MNTTILYGFFSTLCMSIAIGFTTGDVQRTIMVLAVCSLAALILTALVEWRGGVAKRKARADYVARYGEDPGGSRS